ncbi:hypothetical protein ACWFR5_16875 [Streptomyces sp. NPDC055092]
MAEAAETTIGVNPDRVTFTVALEAARDQLITAESVLPGPPAPSPKQPWPPSCPSAAPVSAPAR